MEPFIGEIMMFAGSFAPDRWHFCDGSLLEISAEPALYALIGTTYGGDGNTTFAVPDLRSRITVAQGQGPGLTHRTLGESAGAETVDLTAANLPPHTHAMMAAPSPATTPRPGPDVMLAAAVNTGGGNDKDIRYVPSTVTVGAKLAMAATSIATAGGSVAHANIMPTKALNYIIALEGVFPQLNY